eukprot:9485340-Pyramimonas_sp.AAC.1
MLKASGLHSDQRLLAASLERSTMPLSWILLLIKSAPMFGARSDCMLMSLFSVSAACWSPLACLRVSSKASHKGVGHVPWSAAWASSAENLCLIFSVIISVSG